MSRRLTIPFSIALLVLALGLLTACSDGGQAPEPAPEPQATPEPPMPPPAPAGPDRAGLQGRASALFGTLPAEAGSQANPVTDAKIELGRILYYDPRLSKNQDVSCNSCHQLDNFGVDSEPTSPGHKGQLGGRNSPTVYNAAFHVSQFWDGRAADVEEQAKGPVLNPIEMAMPSEEAVLVVLNSVPGYPPLFAAAFPGEEDPVSYDNMARAIGAFERRLVTPSRFDAFIGGEADALTGQELEGLEAFVTLGCIQCHMGPAIGGGSYQKLGRNVPYPSEDKGREEATGNEADRYFFKVPSLRNVAETGPYFHDGSVATLDEAIRLMGKHQLGVELDAKQVLVLTAFLESLTGEPDEAYVAMPELPESGEDTPAPDPS